MSTEEEIDAPETELKELVTQALEENGLLSKIRAQLRAGLYVALENEINETNKNCHINASLKSNLANPEIRIIFCLVLEFLDHFNLSFTKTVFEKESYLGLLYNYEGKEKLINELEIGLEKISKTPLLLEILRLARTSHKIATKIIENEGSFLNESKDVNKTYDIPQENSNNNLTFINSKEENHLKLSVQDEADTSLSSVGSKGDEVNSNKDKNSPKHDKIISEKTENSPKHIDIDNTYEGTSSIAEDSLVEEVGNDNKNSLLIDFNKTAKINHTNKTQISSVRSLIDQTINESSKNENDKIENLLKPTPKEEETVNSSSSSTNSSARSINSADNKKKQQDKSPKMSPNSSNISDLDSPKTPRLHGNENKISDKPKKPMSGLSSLSDLPPLQISKTRSPDTVLLPSLYSKDFREKSNLKDLDKLLDNFDSIDNYEEDDILSTSLDYDRHKNINSALNSKNLGPKKLVENKRDNVENKISDVNRNPNNFTSENKEENDNTSISEDLDFNSNSEELVKSSGKSDF